MNKKVAKISHYTVSTISLIAISPKRVAYFLFYTGLFCAGDGGQHVYVYEVVKCNILIFYISSYTRKECL